MKTRSSLVRSLAFVTLCGGLLSVSCRRHAVEEEPAVFDIKVDPKLGKNQIADLPGVVYQSQADSPIHWQPWTRETFEFAKDARRIVFCVVAMPQFPQFKEQLDALAADPQVREEILENYVPVLVDGDASREMGLMTSELSAETKMPIQLPFFLWLTSDANPITWTPSTAGNGSAVVELFLKAHAMVEGMWVEDSDYVLSNSALDNANRRRRLMSRMERRELSEKPEVDAVRAIRQMASLYDPMSRTFDNAGGLFPSSAIELLASAAIHPGLRPADRRRCERIVSEVIDNLLRSPMFDPLDGGLFNARRGPSWAFPSFTRDCPSQAGAAVALVQAWRATGNPLALQRAREIIRFAETNYRREDGLFAPGTGETVEIADWLWSVEDIRNALPEEDVDWWIRMSAMKGLGNLPSESDPQRRFFRGNTLSQSTPNEEIAAGLGITPEEFAVRHDKARGILLGIRNERIGNVDRKFDAHLGSSLRMASAYAFAFGATGDPALREKAVDLLDRCRQTFYQAPRLRVVPMDLPAPIADGRAFHYALALQAAIDVATISSDERWLLWAEDLATVAAEKFTGSGFLKECADEAKIIDLPISDQVMLFGDSTAGLVSFVECRLAEGKRPLVKSFSSLAIPLPMVSIDRPILHTDLIQAALARTHPVLLVLGDDLPSDLLLAAERIQPRMVQRRPATESDGVPAGAIKVLLPGGGERVVTDGDELIPTVLARPNEAASP